MGSVTINSLQSATHYSVTVYMDHVRPKSVKVKLVANGVIVNGTTSDGEVNVAIQTPVNMDPRKYNMTVNGCIIRLQFCKNVQAQHSAVPKGTHIPALIKDETKNRAQVGNAISHLDKQATPHLNGVRIKNRKAILRSRDNGAEKDLIDPSPTAEQLADLARILAPTDEDYNKEF